MGKKDISLERLALYQDCLLTGNEQREVEQAVSDNPEYQDALHELAGTEQGLREWGRRKRILSAVIRDLHAPSVSPVQSRVGREWTFSFQPRWAVSFAGILLLVWAGYGLLLSDSGTAASLRVVGNVKTGQIALHSGTDVPAGSSLELGDDSYVSLRMGDRSSLAEFGPQTVATVDGSRSLTVQKGVVWNRVAPDRNHPYLVHTPHGVVRVLGTEFEVEVNDTESIVRVKSGVVEICSARANSTARIEKGWMGRMKESSISAPQVWPRENVIPWRERFSGLTTRDIYRGLRQSQP